MKKLILVLFFFIVPVAHASENFKTSYLVDYTFDNVGRSTVTEHISIINQTGLYATAYQLHLQGTKPQNITGFDSKGPLKIDVLSQTDTDSLLNISFNDVVVGKNNSLNFTLAYNSTPATRNGQVWEVILPKLPNLESIDNYQLKLTIPDNFGQAAFISPPPDLSTEHTFVFSKDQIAKVGVIASFGNLQNYNFTLHYHLRSPQTNLVLPPDTTYQKLVYSSINPPPDNVQSDVDGNWIASYHLGKNDNLDITAMGQVRILSQPTTNLFTLAPDQLNRYILPPDPQYKLLSHTYQTPDQIYQFAQLHPESLTDIFASLASAANIPNRKIEGTVYPQTKIQFWPEYWNGTTWSNLTSDFNHFTFQIHGPASTQAVSIQDFQISYAPYQQPSSTPLEISWKIPFQLFPIFKRTIPLTIINNQHQALYRVPISVNAENIALTSPPNGNIDFLPPYGHFTFPVVISTPLTPDYQSKFIHFGVGSRLITYNIQGQVYLIWQITLGIIISLIIISLGYIAHQTWGLHLQKPPKGDSLRR